MESYAEVLIENIIARDNQSIVKIIKHYKKNKYNINYLMAQLLNTYSRLFASNNYTLVKRVQDCMKHMLCEDLALLLATCKTKHGIGVYMQQVPDISIVHLLYEPYPNIDYLKDLKDIVHENVYILMSHVWDSITSQRSLDITVNIVKYLIKIKTK